MRLNRRIGYVKAIVALAHKILCLIWHLLHNHEFYEESNSSTKHETNFSDPENLQRRERSAINLLTRLNYVITKPTNELVLP